MDPDPNDNMVVCRPQMESVDAQLHPERLKVITQQVPEQHIHSLAQLQHKHEQLDMDVTPACSPQVRTATAADDRCHAHPYRSLVWRMRSARATLLRTCVFLHVCRKQGGRGLAQEAYNKGCIPASFS